MEKLALIYDYDMTLTTMDSAFALTGYGLDKDFYKRVEEERKDNNMEMILSYLYAIWAKAEKEKKPLTKEILRAAGKNVGFFNGVETWFERINEFGRQHGFEVEHYIISSGILEIIEGGPIAKHFKKIFSSGYHYNSEGFADWPLISVNYTNKTQFLFRISKGILNNINDGEVNGYMPKDQRVVKYKNMIYIGDGLTDVPCMKLLRSKNGYAITVYSNNKEKAKAFYDLGRCDQYCLADYTNGSELDKAVKNRILALEKNKEASF